MLKNTILIYFLLILIPMHLHSQTEEQSPDELSNRIEKVEGFQDVINGKFENKSKELELQFKDLTTSLEGEYRILKNLRNVGIPLTILSLIAAILGLIKKMKSIAQTKIEEKYEQLFSADKDRLIEIINNQNEEHKFRDNKKILVLSTPNGDSSFLRKLFKEFKFQKVDFKSVEKHENLGKYDLIFINNENGDFQFELIDSFFENSSKNTVLFYFNTTKRFYNNAKISNRLNFANSKTQIYGNLINLLKYQKIITS